MKPYEIGLSAQRTRLAWRRTAMSAGAVVLLTARPAVMNGTRPTELLTAGLALAGWLALVATAYRRGRGLTAQPPLPGHRTLLAYAVATVGFAVIATVLVIQLALSRHGYVP